MQVFFTVAGSPIGKARHRAFKDKAGNIRMYSPEKTVSRENLIKLHAQQCGPEIPFDGPVKLQAIFYMEIPKSWSKKKQEEAKTQNILPTKKPDLDNMVKLVKDALNTIIWHDDKQVVVLKAAKFYSVKPRTEIHIETIL